MKKWIWIGLLYLAALSSASAQAPEMFRYQGRLVDGTNLVNATLPMSFKLYNAENNGTLLYEDSSSVQIVDGLYSTMIGDDTTLGSLENALTNATVYLELTIDSETLAPRERLVSVPYALNTGGDTDPAGTIVLADTYPNPELEAQGYSLYHEDIETADWEEFDGGYFPYFSTGIDSLGHGNELWAYSGSGMGANVFRTSNAREWTEGSFPYMNPMYFDAFSHGDKVYFFETGLQQKAASTSDAEDWTTWTNDFGASVELREVVLFKSEFFGFCRSNMVSLVFKSANGIDWTQASAGAWTSFDSTMGDEVLASDDKLWVVATEGTSKKIWNSSDGISWSLSVTNIPTMDNYHSEFIFYNEHLWCFTPHKQSCWKLENDSANWSVETTNLPVSSSFMGFEITTHDGKLWMAGQRDSMSPTKFTDLSWSTNGTDWNLSLSTSYGMDVVGTEDGRLWAYVNSSMGQDALYIIGGPKKQDGLYYYRKD